MQEGRMAEWQDSRMAGWQNGRMAEWQDGMALPSFRTTSKVSRWREFPCRFGSLALGCSPGPSSSLCVVSKNFH